ncbi:MAG: FAD-dependent thymidylate synthase [Promethearchaeota archaeon]
MVRYVNQSFQILTPLDGAEMLKRVELAGRTCYKSEDHISADSYLKFSKMLIDRGHLSVIEHVYITVKFISNRGFSHELVRHRTASYSQESTRYCNYSKGKFGNEISVINQRELLKNDDDYELWKKAMENAEVSYMALIKNGVAPQVARGVLPIDLKTEIIITANLREWRHILKLRTSESAHPNIRSLMKKLLFEFKQKIPVIFDDI